MQGFNMGRYIPPEALDRNLSLNAASGKGHALGKRARPSGALIVRFELPFAVWCTTCDPEQIIGQGVRFNAEKTKVGNYYSTPIWAFRFKHTVCSGTIEVRTNPKAAEYVVTEGGRRRDYGTIKEEQWGVLAEGKASEAEKERLEKEGGFAVLEKVKDEKAEKLTASRRVQELWEDGLSKWGDPYERSRVLRKEFRVGRRKRQEDARTGGALAERYALGVEMLPLQEGDVDVAKEINFGERLETVGPSTKPLFPTRNGESTSDQPINATMKSGSSTKNGLQAAQQKAKLQGVLKGNTRSKQSPFLGHTDDTAWAPQVKRRRQQQTPGVQTKTDPGLPHEPYGAVADAATQPLQERRATAIDRQDTSPSAGLVAYDSDSS
jgi:coiled-coil domain-containing protein 130